MSQVKHVLHAEISSLVCKAKSTLNHLDVSTESAYQSVKEVVALLPNSSHLPSLPLLQSQYSEACRIFVSEHYAGFAECLAEKISANWLQPDGSGHRLVELFDICFLKGPEEDSFMVLTRAITVRELSLAVLHCATVLESLLKQNSLARIFELYCCDSHLLSSSEPETYKQKSLGCGRQTVDWQMLLSTIVSLPDVICAKVASDTSEFFYPQSYIPFVGAQLVTVLQIVYDHLRQGHDTSVLILAAVVGRLSLAGFADPLWKFLLSEIELKCVSDFLYQRILQRIIGGIPDRCMESVITQLVLKASSHVVLKAFLGTFPVVSSKVAYVLCHKLLLVRSYEGTTATHVLRNVAGYFGNSCELLPLFTNAFRGLLAAWADASSLRHRPLEQSVYICKAVLAFLTFMPPNAIANLHPDIQQHLLDGLPGYLGSSVLSVRQIGCVVSEQLSGAIHKEGEGDPLKFGLEKNELIESLLEMTILPLANETNSSVCIDEPVMSSLCTSDTCEPKSAAHTPKEMLDSDDDDVEELKPYSVFSSEPQKSTRPLYIAQCIEGLTKSDDPDAVEQCLAHADSLIRKADRTTLSEIGVELCRVLLHLEDQYALTNFRVLRHRAMVALNVMCPAPIAEYLGGEFYSRNFSIRQRMDVLDVLASAATELSQPLGSCPDNLQLAEENVLPIIKSDSSSSSVHWTDVVRMRVEAKTRRFGKGHTQQNLSTSANRFAPVAGAFFYPLTRFVDRQSDACLDLLGSDHLLLERLIYALGAIVLAAVGSPGTERMCMTMLEFVRCVRYHSETGIRRAALYATCTTLATLPPGTTLSEPTCFVEVGEWLKGTAEHDADSECQKRAAQGLLLLDSVVNREFRN